MVHTDDSWNGEIISPKPLGCAMLRRRGEAEGNPYVTTMQPPLRIRSPTHVALV